MLPLWVNKKFLGEKEIEKIRKSFISAKPYPHLVLDNFFNASRLVGVRKAIQKENFTRNDKDLFSFYQTGELKDTRHSIVCAFYKAFSSQLFVNLVKKFTGVKNLSHVNMHAHLYKEGDYLLFHDDVVEGRKIAYIAYLTSLHKDGGGNLLLYDIKNPLKPIKQVSPKFNRFVCFEVSRKSLHAVGEVTGKKQRVSIGGWFYGN